MTKKDLRLTEDLKMLNQSQTASETAFAAQKWKTSFEN